VTEDARDAAKVEVDPPQAAPNSTDGASTAARIQPQRDRLTGEDLGFVMDVPVEVTVEIGRRKMRIADVLKIGPGTVLELDKASGESLDILVNNRLLARGEAVVVGERYGIRLTEVVSLVGKATERS
jgi:flagellar motor switch protein FliN/FliY